LQFSRLDVILNFR